MGLRHREDVQRVEGGRIAFGHVPIIVQKHQNSAPIRTPDRREIEDIGVEPALIWQFVSMSGGEMAIEVSRGHHVRKRDTVIASEPLHERQECAGVHEFMDGPHGFGHHAPGVQLGGDADLVEHIFDMISAGIHQGPLQFDPLGLLQIVELRLGDVHILPGCQMD